MKHVKGKIMLIDDEGYEKEFLIEALKANSWEIKVEFFNNAKEALVHLRENADQIFLIISDMDMPNMNGMEFKKLIDSDESLRYKTIPFVFATNNINMNQVEEAYRYRVQGYFRKPLTAIEQAAMLEKIIQYWISCVHPNTGDE